MVTVTYVLTKKNELDISYRAMSSKATPINLTNHSYFNLGIEFNIVLSKYYANFN